MWKTELAARQELSGLIDALLAESRSQSATGEVDYTQGSIEYLERLREPRAVWSVKLRPIESSPPNRLQNMFGGTPFTSNDHPWPINRTKRPYYPLVQISLSEVGKLVGRDLGTGLLQVWVDVNDHKHFLSNLIRVISDEDLGSEPAGPAYEHSDIDLGGTWDETCSAFSFEFLGWMCDDWGWWLLECANGRELSSDELAIVNGIECVVGQSNYKNIDGDWLMGYPDMGSGSPAGRYSPKPANFLQLASSESFPMVDVDRYANVFIVETRKGISFKFDWG
jgi:hypothetical protein